MPAGAVKVQYRNNNTAASTQQIQPGLAVINTGTAAIPLTRVTLRYWFTSEGTTPTYSTWCDYAQLGCSAVSSRVVRLSTPRPGANAYLEVSFTGGTLAPTTSSGEIQSRLNKTDWSSFTQTDDYSFGSAATYTDAPKVTAYLDGAQVWGSEP